MVYQFLYNAIFLNCLIYDNTIQLIIGNCGCQDVLFNFPVVALFGEDTGAAADFHLGFEQFVEPGEVGGGVEVNMPIDG